MTSDSVVSRGIRSSTLISRCRMLSTPGCMSLATNGEPDGSDCPVPAYTSVFCSKQPHASKLVPSLSCTLNSLRCSDELNEPPAFMRLYSLLRTNWSPGLSCCEVTGSSKDCRWP